MKDYILLNYDYIFNDHMAKCSHEAKLYYIKLMFFANNGFVANPLQVLDSFKFDKGVFNELVANDELLVLPGRDEVFITAYFIHTRFNPASWLNTPFATYWKGKLRTKSNGVATFNKDGFHNDPVEQIKPPGKTEPKEPKEENEPSWDEMMKQLDTPK